MTPDIGDIVYAHFRDSFGFVTDKAKRTHKTKFLYVYWFDIQKVAEYPIGSLLCNSIIKVG